MSTNIQAIRGMYDVLPVETRVWQHIESTLKQLLQSYGYDEIRLPIVEKTELFKRSIGEETDIVEKEMYTFLDRNQESLTLRPEGTACCVRAGIEHGLLYNQIQRLWYMGPFFRYEKPQKGRNRQFYQCGIEIFGLAGPDIDAELIVLSAKIIDKLGLAPYVSLQLNSLGSINARARYREALVNYLSKHPATLDEDSKRRLQTNPLRILDSKNPSMEQLIAHAPQMIDYLDDESKEHFTKLCGYLDALNISYQINPRLVRGLDYYTKTVFEWVTQELGAQGTICAGGRYDGLVEQLGGKATPGLGLAIGIDRTALLVQTVLNQQNFTPALHIYFMTEGDDAFKAGLKLSTQLREAFPDINLLLHCGGGSIKNQFKKADKSGALYALILGEEEQSAGAVTLKSLRTSAAQQTFPQRELVERIKDILQ